jgi:hypothetical protein
LLAGPFVWRGRDELQIGWDSPRLILRGVTPAVVAALRLLDGRHTEADLAQSLGADRIRWLLQALDEGNALGDGPAPPADWPRVHVAGGGVLAAAVADRLTGLGVVLGADKPDLVVLAGPAAEADRVAIDRLAAAGQPHLVARTGFGRAVLGPFVLPGVTACLRCHDLGRRDVDPAWPLMVFQLAQAVGPPEPPLIDWLAAHAALEVAVWRSGRLPRTASAAVVYETTAMDARWEAWPIRADCGCVAATAPSPE